MTTKEIIIIKVLMGDIKSDRDFQRELNKAMSHPYIPKTQVVGW